MTPVRQVLTARLAVARVTKGKTEAVLNRVCADGRLRGIAAYWGAHTGRWAGRGFQPQNLTRPIAGVDYERVHAALQVLLRRPEALDLALRYLQSVCTEAECDMGGLLSSLLRGVLIPAEGFLLAASDYSAVEARGLLWLAGDEEGLSVYRRFDDTGDATLHPYILAAAEIYHVSPSEVSKAQRQAAKVAVLACGYGGSVGAYEAMAPGYGVDLSSLDVDAIVNAWRDGRPKVAGMRRGGFTNDEGRWVVTRQGGLWKDLERAVRLAITAPRGTFSGGRCTWRMDGPHLLCVLPSGRPLVYRDAKIERVLNRWGKEADTVTYFGKLEGISKWGRVETFGGKLSENVTQAVCRDLMADALVQLQGERVVLTVHDEIVAEVQDEGGLQRIEDAMLRTPPWAAGFPVAVEGSLMVRYGK